MCQLTGDHGEGATRRYALARLMTAHSLFGRVEASGSEATHVLRGLRRRNANIRTLNYCVCIVFYN